MCPFFLRTHITMQNHLQTLFSATSYRTLPGLFYAHNVWSSICMSVPFNWISSNQNYSCLSLWKNKVILFPSTMPGSLPGNQTVTLLAINYPELCHCFPSFIKPWTIFLPPVINSSHDDALYPMNQHKREIQTSGIDDKQWQEYLSRTFNQKQRKVSYTK